jgi:murein DD-endopeptidase MepM/ murein hydrolase activator NlpD
METKLFSPLLSSANNIVKMKRSLPKRARDYNDFINWLDTSNKDIKKIKLPKKKKVEDLQFSVGSALGGGGGGGGGGILGSLLAALGIRKGANFLKGKLGLPKGKFKGSYEDIIKKLNKKSNLTKGENFALRDYKRLIGKGGISNNSAAFQALLRNSHMNEYEYLTGHGKGVRGGGFSSETAAQYRQAGRSGGGGFRGAPRGGLGGIAGPLNIAFAGFDFMGRKGEGQSNLQAGVGAGGGLAGGLAGAWAGGKAGAAVGAGIGALFGGVGAAPGAVIGGIIGSLAGGFGGGQLGGNLADKFTGANKIDERLKAQEKKQREAASSSDVTFASITDKFDKVVSKFEKLKLGMTGVQNKNDSSEEMEDSDSIEPTDPIDTGNNPESTGLQLEDVEASGGEVPGAPDSSFRSARRPKHNGNDYFKNAGTPISLIQEGTVTVADMNYNPGGWGALVEVRHKDGSLSRYAHLSKISVSEGSKISPGQVIGYTGGAAGAPGAGNSEGPHLHFEYLPAGSGQVDPTEAAKRIFRFGGNVKVKAKKGDKTPSPVAPEKGTDVFNKLSKAKPGSGETIKVPGVGSVVMGRNLFQQAEKKYFTEKGEQITDPEKIKGFKNQLDAFLKNSRDYELSQAKVRAQPGDPIPAQISQSPPTAAQQSAIFLMGDQSQQVASQPQVVPIPIGNGGGGGGVAVIMPSEGQILNSLWTTMLLTNLSSA